MPAHESADTAPARQSREERLGAVLGALPRGTGGEPGSGRRALIERFIGLWLEHVPSDEIAARADEDLAGAALAHWQLADGAGPSPLRHHALNPAYERDGWQSSHTVLQLVGRDRPWLVSSLRGALLQAGHDVHLLVHPVFDVRRDADGRLLSVEGVSAVRGADGARRRDSRASGRWRWRR